MFDPQCVGAEDAELVGTDNKWRIKSSAPSAILVLGRGATASRGWGKPNTGWDFSKEAPTQWRLECHFILAVIVSSRLHSFHLVNGAGTKSSLDLLHSQQVGKNRKQKTQLRLTSKPACLSLLLHQEPSLHPGPLVLCLPWLIFVGKVCGSVFHFFTGRVREASPVQGCVYKSMLHSVTAYSIPSDGKTLFFCVFWYNTDLGNFILFIRRCFVTCMLERISFLHLGKAFPNCLFILFFPERDHFSI